MDKQELRLTLLTQIFAIILVMKSLATTYFATYYGLHEYEEVIWSYGHTLNRIALLLIIPLLLISINILFKYSEKTKRIIEIVCVIFMMIATIFTLFFSPL